MTLTLDAATEQRLQRELDRGAYKEPSALIAHALDLVEQEEDWLLRNRESIQRSLAQSFAAKERGEIYSPEKVQAHLSERRAARSTA